MPPLLPLNCLGEGDQSCRRQASAPSASKPHFDPGHQGCEVSGPGLGVILAREEVGQFMAQRHDLVARGMEHDAARFVEGLAQEKSGAVPVLPGIGQVIRISAEVDRLLAEGPAKPLRPGFQFREGAHRQQPGIVAMALVAPDLAVEDEPAMLIRL